MMTKSMVESAWAEDIGQFLYNLDPATRKIRRLEKILTPPTLLIIPHRHPAFLESLMPLKN